MKKICFGIKLSGKTAGNKARLDVSDILSKAGYSRLDYSFGSTKIQQKLAGHTFMLRANRLPKNATVVLQYPFCGGLEPRLANLFDKRKDIKLILLIHDVVFLRTPKTVDAETRLINRADRVIVHNQSMKEAFIKHGYTSDKLICLEIFDYLSDKAISYSRKDREKVIIAGNLDRKKSGYIYRLNELDSNLEFLLYGINFSGDSQQNIKYCGSYSPEELPIKLAGGFGLVWDGEDTQTCAGDFGNYLKFNNPHKASLYLASGIPLIVWENSAIANFVTAHGVGITVSSLHDIPSAIARIPQEEYDTMLNHTKQISEKLLSGFYTLRAVSTAETLL